MKDLQGIFHGSYMLLVSSLANILTEWLGIVTAIIGIISGILIARYYYFKGKNERLAYNENKDEAETE